MVNNTYSDYIILFIILFIIIFMSLFLSVIIVDMIDEISYNNIIADIHNYTYYDGL